MEGGLQPISGAFVVGAEDDGEAVFHIEAQFVVVLANPCEFLADRRLKELVRVQFPMRDDPGIDAESLVLNVIERSESWRRTLSFKRTSYLMRSTVRTRISMRRPFER